MGRAIVTALAEHAKLTGVWERPTALGVGAPYFDNETLTLHGSPEPLAGEVDVVIDFTAPAATVQHAEWCAANGVGMVIGTTGLSDADLAALDTHAASIPIVQAPNMSVGVNALCALIDQAARMLGGDYDIEIIEAHHRHKKDAPSGTALRLLQVLLDARGGDPVFERHGDIGARKPDEIGVQTVRGGDVVGEHTVFFFGEGERLELTHRATDRGIFAAGAVRAATWVAGRKAGRYSMADVLLG